MTDLQKCWKSSFHIVGWLFRLFSLQRIEKKDRRVCSSSSRYLAAQVGWALEWWLLLEPLQECLSNFLPIRQESLSAINRRCWSCQDQQGLGSWLMACRRKANSYIQKYVLNQRWIDYDIWRCRHHTELDARTWIPNIRGVRFKLWGSLTCFLQ